MLRFYHHSKREVNMPKLPNFDVHAAHKYFSVKCFNKAWDLMDKSDRTAEEDEQMVRLSLTSHWHWTQREDYTEREMSSAHWQTSRIYAMLGQADNARRYGQLCLAASQGEDLPPFCLGYAYEALARAESVAGNSDKMEKYLRKARRVADTMSDPDVQKQFLEDLDTIE
jgi:hypothetical protein